MKKHFSIVLVSLILLAALHGCGGKKTVKDISCSALYAKATDKFNKKDYFESKEILHEILYKCSGSKETVKIMHLLGMSYFHLKKYSQAEYQFRDIVRDFNSDSLAESAQFMVGKCLLAVARPPDRDQEESKMAFDEFSAFIEEFPNSALLDSAKALAIECRNKMGHKEFLTGTLYKRLQEYGAAVIYFETVIKDYSDTKWLLPASYELAVVLAKDNKADKATTICQNLLAEKLPDELKKKTERLLKRLKK